ncbi:HTH lysR-type domain-containing protein [Cupriavidus sp. H19C3]|uniref:LysR substrate-binding domain-containing protein n=1 Tax=Cupriavidus sp. H19C3 TaxID=3241603 RepID=UPI0011DA895D|nr:MAG: LysR family transcriptional regulator [Cupriavidus sp.]
MAPPFAGGAPARPMHTDLKQLRYFVALADTLSFTAAASKLRMTQPALSIAIQRLEESMGVELLRRTSRMVELTAAGEAYAKGARDVLALMDQVERTAVEVASGREGLCRIGFVQSSSFDVVPPVLKALQETTGKIKLELHESTSTDQLIGLSDGKLDVGLIRQAIHGFAGISLQHVHEQRMVAALPASHRLARAATLPLSALRDEVFVMVPDRRSPALNARVLAACADAGFQPHTSLEVVEMATILPFVGEGLGVSLLPANCRRFADRAVALVDLEDTSEHLSLPLFLAWRKREKDPAVRRVLDVAKAAIRNLSTP